MLDPRIVVVAAAALLGVAGCGGAEPAGDPEPELVVDLAPITTQTTGDPLEAQARDAAAAERYEEASAAYETLSKRAADPSLRAEFLFLAAESALAAGQPYPAFELYQRLLREYPSTPRFTAVVERLYVIGRLFCLGKAERKSWLGIATEDREFGIQVLRRFIEARERHPRADDALHAIALARLDMHEWEEAIDAWERLAREYPDSEWAQTAEYRAALTLLEMSDGARYDKIPLEAGRRRLVRYLQRHPKGNHAKEAEEKLREVEEALARQKLDVVHFYLRRDEVYSADVYLAAILREYPGTEAASEAKTLRDKLPRVSPPPPPPDPGGPGAVLDEEERQDRVREAAPPVDDSW